MDNQSLTFNQNSIIMIKNIKWILIASLGMVSCSQDVEDTSGIQPEVAVSAGSADFSRYVALGNSLTAGFSDGTLFKAGQMNAYPKLLSDQFAMVGGGSFTTPLMNDNVGGLLLGGTQIQGPRLIFNGTAPVPLPGGVPTTDVLNTLTGPFNNMGVPGAKSFHLLAPNYGNPAGIASGAANPFYARFASTPSARIIDDAVAQNPTFFSLWIGNNDVLSYATSGGTGINQLGNIDPTTYGGNDITDPNLFASAYAGIVDAMTANGAKGVVANIPYVTSIPHFTTVPFNPLSPTNPSFGPQIPTLNATFAQLNQAFAFLGVPERSISFSTTGPSAVVIQDESLTNIAAQLAPVLQAGGLDPLTAGLFASQFGQCRQANAGDLLVLPSSSVIGVLNTARFNALVGLGVPAATAGQLAVNGVTFPLEDKWVLVPTEQAAIKEATDAFNATIKSIADANDLAFVDANAVLNQLASGGILFGTYHFTAQFVRGGAFGLDGVHLTARANAYIANKFLEAIEKTYGSSFKKFKPQDFPLSYPAFLP